MLRASQVDTFAVKEEGASFAWIVVVPPVGACLPGGRVKPNRILVSRHNFSRRQNGAKWYLLQIHVGKIAVDRISRNQQYKNHAP
jgi:hypothetical protein